jgi:hypothetical protein
MVIGIKAVKGGYLLELHTTSGLPFNSGPELEVYVTVDALLERVSELLVVPEKKPALSKEEIAAVMDHGCGYACGFQEPYGFVPEAGCPVHDGVPA